MFPDKSPYYSINDFFKEWKKNSIFSRLIGPPPVLLSEFGTKWIDEVIKKKLADSPLVPYILAHYGFYIENIKSLKGYKQIKEKLEQVDDRFFPIMSEIEFLDLILKKVEPDNIYLEGTFQTQSGKNPEFKIIHNSDDVYFEVTSIMDYKEMDIIVNNFVLYSILLLSFKILYGIDRSLNINISEYSNSSLYQKIYDSMNDKLGKEFISNLEFDEEKDEYYVVLNKDKSLKFSYETEQYSFMMDEGKGVIFNLPDDVIENKIKDKINSKLSQLDDGLNNFVVLDVTSMGFNKEKLIEHVKYYYEYTENEKLSGVLLFLKMWDFEEGGRPVYQREVIHIPNQRKQNIEYSKQLIKDIIFHAFT